VDSAGALIVYDITNAQSFKNAEVWLQELKNYANSDIGISFLRLICSDHFGWEQN
jgi:GTPase SAR1 family protein